MDNEPAIVPVPSPPRRGASAIVVVGVVLLALAVLKPWAAGQPSGVGALALSTAAAPGSTTPAGTPSTPAATPTSGVADPNAMACMSSEGSRVLALQRAPGLEVRTWLTVDNVSLTNPFDPTVVPLRLLSSDVIGLGICARRLVQDATLSSAAGFVDVERLVGYQFPVIGGGPPAVIDLGVPRIITSAGGDPTVGALYGAPAGATTAPGPAGPASSSGPSATPTTWPTWPVGDYAIEFRFPGDARSVIRWLRLEILPAVGRYG